MSQAKPSPKKIAAEILARLEAGGDPVQAAGAHRYFREEVEFYGWTSSAVRALTKEIHAGVRGTWILADALALAEILLREEKFEAKSAGILLLLQFKKEFTPAVFRTIKSWLAKDYCANWASVDTLCPEGLGGLIERHPDLADEILGWTTHRGRWVQRGSIVAFVSLARHGKFLDQAYRVAEAMLGTDDDLLQKAAGWMLREAGKTDMPRLRGFLLKHGPRIPRTSLRYAIEKFPPDERKALLLATKPNPRPKAKRGS
ncbi:MAG: DNA alkylation repair protein [Acidobacteriota bacterium]|nr:DNA alkylation repair protein [Acidobacteriota bacterium]